MNQLLFQVNLKDVLRETSHSAQGTLAISWNSYGMLSRIDWVNADLAVQALQPGTQAALDNRAAAAWAPAPILDLVERLQRYLESGQPLGTLPWEWMDQTQWTPFQYQVYAWIAKIPHGETRTYGWVAQRIGKGTATRAVGQALRKNPLPIFIPCHRVVGADSLGGFMGAKDPDQPELSLKKRLLALEQSYLNPSFSFMAGQHSAGAAFAG